MLALQADGALKKEQALALPSQELAALLSLWAALPPSALSFKPQLPPQLRRLSALLYLWLLEQPFLP